jgi:hypothetical protein
MKSRNVSSLERNSQRNYSENQIILNSIAIKINFSPLQLAGFPAVTFKYEVARA